MTLAQHDRIEAHPGRAGVMAMAPMVFAYVPIALVIGSTAARVHAPLAGWAGSWLVFAGSAHLAALHALGDGPTVAIVTALLVNLRLVVYGASLAPTWRDQPRWFRMMAPALLTESTWAFAERQDSLPPAAHRRFYLGVALTLGVVWSGAIAAGAIAGDHLPDVGLELAAPLCLLALLAHRLRDASHRAAAVAAAVAALATQSWPTGTGILAAISCGWFAARVAKTVSR